MKEVILRTANRLRPGEHGTLSRGDRKLYLHHRTPGRFVLTPDAAGGAEFGKYAWGAPFWREIHGKARTLATPAERAAYVASIYLRLPCGDCKSHWQAYLVENPPPFDSSEALFRWTFEAHDHVSARKGLTRISFDEAKKLYPALK